MFDLIKNTINSGKFKYLELQNKIARLYAMGNITEAELVELLALAAEKANPDAERPEMLELIQALAKKVEAISADVAALKASGSVVGNVPEYTYWQPWDGLSDNYQLGSIVSHKDQLWQSVYSGQNVWEPGTVDDRFWIRFNPET